MGKEGGKGGWIRCNIALTNGWFKYVNALRIGATVIYILVATSAPGQTPVTYKSVDIDSLLQTPVVLSDDNAYRIGSYRFKVHYAGELIMVSPYAAVRYEQLNRVHPEVKLILTNSSAVFKTRGGRKLAVYLERSVVLDKLKAFGTPTDLRIMVKMIKGNYKSTRNGRDYRNVRYRDFIVQDVEAVD